MCVTDIRISLWQSYDRIIIFIEYLMQEHYFYETLNELKIIDFENGNKVRIFLEVM